MLIIDHSIVRMCTDKIDARYMFLNPFKVTLIYGEKDRVLGNSGDLVWYINGSKTKEGTGAEVYGLRSGLKSSIPLGLNATVFQVEVMGINDCVQEILKRT